MEAHLYPINQGYIPYDSLSSTHFQIVIGAPKRHLFDQQFWGRGSSPDHL